MLRIVCALIGHNWFNLAPSGVTPFVECYRCKKTGWLFP